MSAKPLISVVMAVYNGEDYLRAALDSILMQSFSDWECIIVDDGSVDSTADILAEYAAIDSRFRLLPNGRNLRLPASLNRAVQAAAGKYIARMDNDDICLPGRFEKQYGFMEKHPELAASFCKFFTLTDDVCRIGVCGRGCTDDVIAAMLSVTNPVLHPGVIARSEVMKSNPYDVSLTCSEDLELWMRLISKGMKIGCMDEYLMLYRIHGKQITAAAVEKQSAEVRRVEEEYYRRMLFEPSEEELDVLMNSIYFVQRADFGAAVEFYRKLLRANRERGSFTQRGVSAAFIEIIFKYKHSLPFLYKVKLLGFNRFGVFGEYIRKKRRAAIDVKKARKIAGECGMEVIPHEDGLLPAFRFFPFYSADGADK